MHRQEGWLTEDPTPTLVTELTEEILKALCGPITGPPAPQTTKTPHLGRQKSPVHLPLLWATSGLLHLQDGGSLHASNDQSRGSKKQSHFQRDSASSF